MKKHLFISLLLLVSGLLHAQNERFPREENVSRIMSYNVRNGKGLDNVTDLERTAKVILSVAPEVVAIQELDSVTGRSNQVDVLKKLSELTGMYPVYGAAIPYNGGKYGLGILSKERPQGWKNIPLPGREEERTLLVVEFDKYVLCATHWSLTKADREASVNIVNQQANQFDKPVFLVGDLNAEPASDEIKQLTQSWKILNNAKAPTFPANQPKECIDYILGYTAKGQSYAVLQTQVVNEPMASDHRPLFADVRFKVAPEQVMRTLPFLQNPSTDGMTVMWMTNVPCRSWVEFGTDPTNMKRVRSFIEGEMVANNTINKIKLEKLSPGTQYYYRVCSQEITVYKPYYKEFGDTVCSQVYSFVTWDDKKKDVTVLVFNDLHKKTEVLDALHNQIKDINYDLVIFNGDCIDDAQTEADIVETVDHLSRKLGCSSTPSIFMRGNHETRGAYSVKLWDYLERKGANSFGAFNLGGVRFVFLDNGEDKPDDHWVYYDMNDFEQHRTNQKEFLEKEIASKDYKLADKRVLIHHIPIYGESMKKYYNPWIEPWGNVLSKGKFDVALNGHTHRYEYIPKMQDSNPFPIIIGGGNRVETATVSILKKQGKNLTLDVMDSKGENKLHLDL